MSFRTRKKPQSQAACTLEYGPKNLPVAAHFVPERYNSNNYNYNKNNNDGSFPMITREELDLWDCSIFY